MHRCPPCPALLSLALLLSACGHDPSAGQQRPPLGTPIAAPLSTWTWIDFPDSTCDEGTPTGLGINLSGGKNLLIFLNGGGACWDYATCFQLNTAAHGPFRKQDFDQLVQTGAAGSVLGREDSSPFRDWNLVFVPYCTGDVHIGDADASYTGPGGMARVFHHRGRANLTAFLRRLAATLPQPDKVVFSGSSAGGFGSALNYDLFRQYFPTGQAYLLDDSGPALRGDAIPSFLRDAWYKSWGLGTTLSPLCPGCQDDLSMLIPILSARYPRDRKALLSYTQDQVIRGFFFQSPTAFQANLYDFATAVLDPAPDVRYFFETGDTHTMLGSLTEHVSQGEKLNDWLKQMVGDDVAWASVKP